MKSKQETLCLFFPEPLDDADQANLLASGVTRVQLFLGIAWNRQEELRWLASQGRRVNLRLEEPSRYRDQAQVDGSYYGDGGRARIHDQVAALQQLVEIEAVIVGNEPEWEYDLRRGSPSWGDRGEPLFPKGRAWEHQSAVGRLRTALEGLGAKVVAPGYSHRRVTPRDEPQPGRATWARICAQEYNRCTTGGAHLYAQNWLSEEDRNRYLWAAGIELERIHTPVWINETNVASKAIGDVERMRAALSMYELLAEQEWSASIESFCPFVSNGRTGESWSHMIMRDPAAYGQLGERFQR